MTRDEAKAYLRLENSGEDALVDRLVASATALAEAFIGQRLIRGETIEDFAGDGRWQRLAVAPVTAIVAVARVGADGVAVPLAADGYAIDIDPGGDGWVRASGASPSGGRLRVTYSAGMAEGAEGVPAAITHGVVRLAAHLYAHRDDSVGPPAAVAALWRPFRRMRLGLESRA